MSERTLYDAVLLARSRGLPIELPVSGPELEACLLALHHAGITHNYTNEPYCQRVLAGKGDYALRPA